MTQQATQMVLHIFPRAEEVMNEVLDFLIWRKLSYLFITLSLQRLKRDISPLYHI